MRSTIYTIAFVLGAKFKVPNLEGVAAFLFGIISSILGMVCLVQDIQEIKRKRII